jgi:hypothetical protein
MQQGRRKILILWWRGRDWVIAPGLQVLAKRAL